MNKLKYMDKNFYIKYVLHITALMVLSVNGYSQAKSKRTNVVVFIDKSLSVNYNNGDQSVKSTVQNGINLINKEGDTYTMFYIHSNTLGATPAIAYKVKPVPLQSAEMSMLIYNKHKQGWAVELIKDKHLKIQETESYVFSDGVSKTNKATDVWAIFEKLSRVCMPSSNNNVIIFSDMIESMNGTNRRSKLNPNSKKQAVEWAHADQKIIDAIFSVNQHNLKNTNVQVVLPYSALSSTFNANVRYYWEELFSLYDMKVDFV